MWHQLTKILRLNLSLLFWTLLQRRANGPERKHSVVRCKQVACVKYNSRFVSLLLANSVHQLNIMYEITQTNIVVVRTHHLHSVKLDADLF
jgi:hypothetical protein